jgi:uncharacterized membrane protein YukC
VENEKAKLLQELEQQKQLLSSSEVLVKFTSISLLHLVRSQVSNQQKSEEVDALNKKLQALQQDLMQSKNQVETLSSSESALKSTV